jgi:hypothetical protein
VQRIVVNENRDWTLGRKQVSRTLDRESQVAPPVDCPVNIWRPLKAGRIVS